MENAIEIRNLSKKYKNFALSNINISLPKGYIMGFIGENGAGKTTTINAILNLIKKDSGYIKVFGKDHIEDELYIKENIGVVLDDCFFNNSFTALNIMCILKNIYKNFDPVTYKECIEKFSIPMDKKIRELSKGMRMKLSIAVALSHNAKLLILDEPTSGLDPVIRDEILDIFRDFIIDEDRSVFISSHIISDLEKIADYITFIHNGKIVLSEGKDEILEEYLTVNCTKEQFNSIDKKFVVSYRKSDYAYKVLVKGKSDFNILYSDMITERITLEEMMIMIIRGEKL